MKIAFTILFSVCIGITLAQDPWKNIYSQQAWAERDKWQKADELIDLLGIKEGSVVADVGSHEGYMTFKLAERVGEQGIVYAVDLDQPRLSRLEKHAQENGIRHIRTIKGLSDNPKLTAGNIDAVIILDTYHEMDDHDKILQHIKTSLKRGGRLLICEPIADSRRNLPRADQEKKHELAMGFALDDLRKAGFRIVMQKENFIDRTKQKGDKMWVAVGEKN